MNAISPRACVIGWPITHSRSPLIHKYWLNHHGLAGSYERVPVEPENLNKFFDLVRAGSFVGCNVTLPHKQAATAYIDHADERVRRIGALNTVWREGDFLHATSTDGPGYASNLLAEHPDFRFDGTKICVLGAGGSARSIVDELLRRSASRIIVHNRTQSRATELALHFGKGVLACDRTELPARLQEVDLVINTTSAGIGNSDKIEIPWHSVPSDAIISDISYVPLVTPFLKEAAQNGHRISTGLGMLLHQAVLGFEKWFGVRPEVTPELYALVARDIDPDFQP